MQSLDHATVAELDKKQLHPLQTAANHANPVIVERGEGVWLYTTDGRKILDGMAGLWNVNIGYGNQELGEVAREQMGRLAYTSNFAGMTNPPSAALAARLAGYAYPGLNHTFFTSGGSESNDSAFKTARYYWKRMGQPGKYKIIARKGAYHGITLAATFATGVERYHRMFGPAVDGFLHIPAPYPYRFEVPLEEGESIGQAAARALEEAILREGAGTVAAFIAEPVMGVGGVIVPPDDYFPAVRQICDRHDVLFIADEVITGWGRTGEMFALNRYGVAPDILSFAKGVTSGYLPLGGIQVHDRIWEAIMTAAPEDGWMHGYTYSGHAAACAVGLKNIEIIERENLVENAARMGARLVAGLETLRQFNCVGDVRGLGLLAALEFVKDRETKEPDVELATQVMNTALARGVRSRSLGASLAFSPGLGIDEAEVDEIINVIGSVIDSLAA